MFWWGHTPTKTSHFLSSVVGNRPNAIALTGWLTHEQADIRLTNPATGLTGMVYYNLLL